MRKHNPTVTGALRRALKACAIADLTGNRSRSDLMRRVVRELYRLRFHSDRAILRMYPTELST